ncbi:MAG: 3-oxoacyl-ACP reductase FabG [Steroidobacteraceae bacterium]
MKSSAARRALVTGGSGAIGAAICRRLAAAGHFVYIHAHLQVSTAEALAAELNASSQQAAVVTFDVTDERSTRQRLEALLEDGPIQILVNNAGIHDDAVFLGMSARQWHRVVDVGVDGFFNVTQPLTMPMVRTRWGRIISIASVSGLIGNPGQVNYSAAKGAIIAATRSLAIELASRKITVNAVAPGFIAAAQATQTVDPATILRRVPMKRAGRPEEVASLVEFLASEDAAYITGQTISISGGLI